MTIAFYMNCVSAHQLPLAKEVAELVGAERFRYIDAGEESESAQSAETQGLKFKVQSLKSPEREDARERLFHSGDWKGLARLIEKEVRGELPSCSIGEWTAKSAAKRLMEV